MKPMMPRNPFAVLTGTAIVFFFVFGAASVSGQSAERIDGILAEEELRYGSAAYLLLGVSGDIDADASEDEALELLEDLEFALNGKQVNEPVTLGELALLIMRVYEIDGGWAYRLLGQPRYAARELAFSDVIQGRAFPGMNLTGERGLRIINRTASLRAEGEI